MADIAVTAAQVALCDPLYAEVYDFENLSTDTMTLGAPVYIDPTTGRIGLADANAAGKQQFAGIVVGVRGKGISVLVRGRCYGFTLSGLNFFAPAYLSDTVGRIADAAGTMSVIVGKVVPITENGQRVKVLFVNADYLRVWS